MANVAADMTKAAIKKVILAKLKVPLIILAGILFLLFLIFGFLFSMIAMTSDKSVGIDSGWDIGEITEFGKNEIPAAYIPIYEAAAEKYGVPWNLLAAHHRVETRFSTLEVMISPVGAIGHMQFMPLTWIGWSYGGTRLGDANIPESVLTDPDQIKKHGGYGTDGNGDGKADPWDLEDAIHTAAKYLAKNGAADGRIRDAVFAYNHSEKYVSEVLSFADQYVSGYVSVGGGTTAKLIDGVAWPVPGTLTITSHFGTRTDPITGASAYHSGMDIAGPGVNGKPVVAMFDGTVIKSGYNGGLGLSVTLRHEGGMETVYGHLSALNAPLGKKVKAGKEIGKIGSTGRSTGPHLHLMVRINGNLADPAKYLKKFKFKEI